MIIITLTYTRPDLNTPFFSAPAELKTQFLEKYRYTGKSISTAVTHSPDGLTAVVTNKWRSQADLDEFRADTLSDTTRALREAHIVAHNLQLTTDISNVTTPGA